MLILSLCASVSRFQVPEASSQAFCFANKFVWKDVDSEPLWLRASFQDSEASTQSFYFAIFFHSQILIRSFCDSDPDSRFLKPHHNPFVLPIISYSKMLIRSLCGSGARFQISEALSQSFCFAIKFLSKDVDGEPLWLRSQITGFWNLIPNLLFCYYVLIIKWWFWASVAQWPDSQFRTPNPNSVVLSSSY